MAGNLTLLLGGARSGKSGYAQQWAHEHGRRVLFVATAQAFDDDMAERIARHRAERPSSWGTLEAPVRAAEAIRPIVSEYDTILLDCITLLASNVLLGLPEDCTQAQSDQAVLAEIEALVELIRNSTANWLIVSNEVGMGIVPHTSLGRYFRDSLGRANQRLAQAADDVLLLVAGIAWPLKSRKD